MLGKKGSKIFFSPGRCTQCGVCAAACPHDAITCMRGKEQYSIVIDKDKCVHCGLCVRNCAANLLDGNPPDEAKLKSFESVLAWARDEKTRYYASSGGFVRAAIHEMLSRKMVAGVYTLRYHADEDDLYGEWIREDIPDNEIPQSQYRVLNWGRNLLTDCPEKGNVLLVGLACQLKAAVQLLSVRKPQLAPITICILCRKNKRLGFSRYIARQNGTPHARLTDIRYRGDGWPGTMHTIDNGVPTKGISFRYHAYCWNLRGCEHCLDGYYMDGDFTVGDPWDIIDKATEPLGKSLVHVHSPKAKQLLESFRSIAWEQPPAPKLDYEICLGKHAVLQNYALRIKHRIKAFIGEFVLNHFR